MSLIGNKIPIFIKLIQPIIHQEIQPVINREIQPVINEQIQPVIFTEMSTNIEEVIQQLEKKEKSKDKQNDSNKIVNPKSEKEDRKKKVEFKESSSSKNIDEKKPKLPIAPNSYLVPPSIKIGNLEYEIQPYIMYEEQHIKQHITKNIIQPIIQKEVRPIMRKIYVPYIQNRNGNIYPYEKKTINANPEKMETTIAVNFISPDQSNYPMVWHKTEIFADIVERLYKEFPELKSKKLFFMANGNLVNRSFTFEQNKIKTGTNILINEEV